MPDLDFLPPAVVKLESMADKDVEIRIFGVANDSIVDGPGLRYSIYTQGCTHHCKGCHNEKSWDFNGGKTTTVGALIDDVMKNKLINNVTISGGDPFDQARPVAALVRELISHGYKIWAYSGYTFEELSDKAKSDCDVKTILDNIEVLVDGPFELEKKSLSLKWRGSSNQRVIDMVKTNKTGQTVLFKEQETIDKIPPNW